MVSGDTPETLERVAGAYCKVVAAGVHRASSSKVAGDGWSAAAYQHWQQASLRSIEQGRYLARAANTGVSGFVDPYGRVLQKSALFEPAVLVADVRYLQVRTVYSRIGDVIAWLSLAFTAAALLASRRIGGVRP